MRPTPLLSGPTGLIPRRIADLEIGDTGPRDFARSREGFHRLPHVGLTESFDHTGVDENVSAMRQRDLRMVRRPVRPAPRSHAVVGATSRGAGPRSPSL